MFYLILESFSITCGSNWVSCQTEEQILEEEKSKKHNYTKQYKSHELNSGGYVLIDDHRKKSVIKREREGILKLVVKTKLLKLYG